MRPTPGKLAAIAIVVAPLLLAGGLIGTGAVDVGQSDVRDALFGDDEPQVVMTPHDGPNGQYVVESENGELEVDFSDPGLTRDARLQFHRVFDLVNEDDDPVVVWVTHGNEETIRLYDHDTGRTIAGEANAIALAPGERVVVSVDVDSRGVTVDDLVTTVTFAAQFDAPFFEVDITEIDDAVAAGQTVGVDAEVTNVGTVAGEREVRLLVDGEVVDSTSVSLDGEGTETVEFAYETDAGDIGDRTVTVETDDDSDEREVAVEPTTEAFFDVTIDGIADAVDVGDRLTVDATVENVGGTSDTRPVELVVDGEVVDERSVELDNGSSTTVELGWTPREGDEGEDVPVTVRSADSEDTAVVDVNGGLPGDGSSGESGDDGAQEPSSGDGESSMRTEVDFGGDDTEYSASEVSRDEMFELDEATADLPPRAFIYPREDRGRALEEDRTVTIDGERRTLSADRTRIMLAGEATELSGERSRLSSGDAIASRDRMIGAVDIDVPANRRDRPATVRFGLDRDRFGESDPDAVTIGHRTDDGWELLSTEVVESTDEEVILTAETPGFSVFAVFADHEVRYEWTLPDGSTAEGPVLNHTFADPGIYDVELTVTDAFGRVSTATYQVLANDAPESTIEVVEREGETTTLAANVENEIGDTNVTWTFPDGTEATGTEVTHDLEDGSHEIDLRVVDEYGAESETRHTIAVGPPWAAVGSAAESLGMSLELMIQLGMLALIGSALALGYRRFPWTVFSLTGRHGPEITAFEAPTVKPDVGRFSIESLQVESGSSALKTITVEAIGDGDRTAIQKRIDASGMERYNASPEALIAPPGSDFDGEGRYTIRIKATDENGRSVERRASVATAAAGDGSVGHE
jgi:hypothetical protein